jgi:hypothetical protein
VAYCPECLVEYAQGSPECIDCRVPLISGSSPARERSIGSDFIADLDLVTVRSFMGSAASFNAEQAKSVLDAHGILCTLMGQNSARVFPLHCMVLLQVERNNLAQAAEILEGIFDNPEPQVPEEETEF